jgi:hypothetical protein
MKQKEGKFVSIIVGFMLMIFVSVDLVMMMMMIASALEHQLKMEMYHAVITPN